MVLLLAVWQLCDAPRCNGHHQQTIWQSVIQLELLGDVQDRTKLNINFSWARVFQGYSASRIPPWRLDPCLHEMFAR